MKNSITRECSLFFISVVWLKLDALITTFTVKGVNQDSKKNQSCNKQQPVV